MKNQTERGPGWDLSGSVSGGKKWPNKAWQQQRIEASLRFDHEPIIALDNSKRVLYLVRTVSMAAELGMSLSMALGASMDMVRWFDRLLMQGTIEALRVDPQATLGCSVSGTSAVDDIWWDPVFQLLEREPGVAERLVVEFAEAAPLDVKAGREFVWRLKWCGCRVAIKEFGIRYGVQSAMAVGEPDFIKLDRTLVCAARQSEHGKRRLSNIVRLASEQASTVIIETMDADQDAGLALEAGVHWAQFRSVQEA
ncbi:EAL domain-containing protein [Burkholderia gladioli]|uniref:EAL domain-containing protein n=1 Tax=Burkholderia gladioli TaxID=28095 RepID=UPI003F79B2CF